MPAIKASSRPRSRGKSAAAKAAAETAQSKAVIRDAVFYGEGPSRQQAPKGEYEMERRDACIGFCLCGGACAFTLSFDAFLQHLNEGRIALVA